MLDYGKGYLEENERSLERLKEVLTPEALTVALSIFPDQDTDNDAEEAKTETA